MKSSRWPILLQGGVLLLVFFGLGYWAWQRYRPPAVPLYEGNTLDQWVVDLDDPDYRVSKRAADVLAGLGAEAVPVLQDARGRGDVRLHRRAAAVLVRIGAPAVPGLTAELLEKPREQRIEVVLVRLGTAAVPALRDALHDEQGSKEAARVLGLIGPDAREAVPDLIAILQRPQTATAFRQEIVFALGRIGEPTAEVVPVLSLLLREGSQELRGQAADALAWIGPPAREAPPVLCAALQDDEATAKKACQALASLDDATATAALYEAFQGKREAVAREAGRALWQLGDKARDVWPKLLSQANGPLEKTLTARNLLAAFGPRVVPLLAKGMRADDAGAREAAVEILGRIGPPARAAVPDLLDALKDKAPAVALTAALALAEIDPTRAGPAVPLLADALDTPGAADALANVGPDARAAAPALIAALKPGKNAETDEPRAAPVRLALARIGTSAVPALLDALRDKNKIVASRAAETLGWILPPPTQAVPALRQALKDDPAHAGAYARALGQLGPVARAAVGELASLLTDAKHRADAAVALVRLDPAQAERVVPLLVKDLQGVEEATRERALAALTLLGPAAKAAAPDLVKALSDRASAPAALHALLEMGAGATESAIGMLRDANVESRQLAIALLASSHEAARAAIPALIAALSDSDRAVQAGAVRALEEIGPDAAAAVPALIANLQNDRIEVRRLACLALGHVGAAAKEACRPLVECLLDPGGEVRYAATLALGRIDPTFTEAVPPLRAALRDPYPQVRLAAIDALSHLDRATIPETTPLLVPLAQKPDDLHVRFGAVEGLLELAPERAKAYLPWLETEINDVDFVVRINAGTLLARIDPTRNDRAVLALAGALHTPLPEARKRVLQTLANFGPKAREALPLIARLLQDGAPGMRAETIRTLRAIDAKAAERYGVRKAN